jgi:hypothetical protein
VVERATSGSAEWADEAAAVDVERDLLPYTVDIPGSLRLFRRGQAVLHIEGLV